MENKNYTKLSEGQALGFKIATRKIVNDSLSEFEAYDNERFLKGLKILFGDGDLYDKARMSYSILDNKRNIIFEAFVGSSGPSYGGTVKDYSDITNLTLRQDVLESLLEFDQLLENTIIKPR